MSFGPRVRQNQARSNENSKVSVKSFSETKSNMSSSRPALKVLQPSAVNRDFGKPSQAGKGTIPKRKQWIAEGNRGLKKVKMEVKSTQTEEINSLEDAANEAYELMVKETPPPAYWKAIAEERRKALFDVLQENEKLYKDLEAKEERISRLKSQNEELCELADHVEYMADLIERLTGKGPENLEELKALTLHEEDGNQNDSEKDERQNDSEKDETQDESEVEQKLEKSND
ncbi:geminin [Stigmatopora nigra]